MNSIISTLAAILVVVGGFLFPFLDNIINFTSLLRLNKTESFKEHTRIKTTVNTTHARECRWIVKIEDEC